MGAKSRAVGFLLTVELGMASLPAEVNNGGYPTVSAAVGFRSREQRNLFSFNEYRVLPA